MSKTVEELIKEFKTSSNFTPGDPNSFQIPLGKYSLPGKNDPNAYLQFLDINDLTKKFAVVCPGNGGLCTALLAKGVKSVTALEPRSQFERAITSISGLCMLATNSTFNVVTSLAPEDKFDYIIWPEGLEQTVTPLELFNKVYDVLTPGGKLFIEVTHGYQNSDTPSGNSWRPTQATFKKVLLDKIKYQSINITPGRLELRNIYTITKENKILPPVTTIETKQEIKDNIVNNQVAITTPTKKKGGRPKKIK